MFGAEVMCTDGSLTSTVPAVAMIRMMYRKPPRSFESGGVYAKPALTENGDRRRSGGPCETECVCVCVCVCGGGVST